MSIGRRCVDARKTGYPYVVVIGKSAVESTPLFEVHDQNSEKQIDLTIEQLRDFFENNDSSKEIERKAITV